MISNRIASYLLDELHEEITDWDEELRNAAIVTVNCSDTPTYHY